MGGRAPAASGKAVGEGRHVGVSMPRALILRQKVPHPISDDGKRPISNKATASTTVNAVAPHRVSAMQQQLTGHPCS